MTDAHDMLHAAKNGNDKRIRQLLESLSYDEKIAAVTHFRERDVGNTVFGEGVSLAANMAVLPLTVLDRLVQRETNGVLEMGATIDHNVFTIAARRGRYQVLEALFDDADVRMEFFRNQVNVPGEGRTVEQWIQYRIDNPGGRPDDERRAEDLMDLYQSALETYQQSIVVETQDNIAPQQEHFNSPVTSSATQAEPDGLDEDYEDLGRSLPWRGAR